MCQGIKDIEDIHPLRKTVGWSHVSACCKVVCCCAKKKKPFSQAVKSTLLKKFELEAPEENLDEPYLILGYGINAYFAILASVSKMFFWVTVFAIPMYYIYSSGGHLKGFKSYPISQFSIGNFGGSTMFCKQTRLATGKMNL